MDVSAIVAVFPNAYSRRHAALLASNIRAMLRSRSLPVSSVKRDGQVITVDAHDPVMASSAIGLLFGTGRVAIARRAGTGMDELVEAISVTASSLLLKGERFVVQIDGSPKGYLARDAEMAATSAIISGAKTGAKPGTQSSHDRLIYAHVSKSSSYVSIFSDTGRGGVPFGAHTEKVVCPVYDDLSALAMLETLRQGHDVLPTVVYSSDAARTRIAKPVCRIVSFIPRAKTVAEFVRTTARRAEMSGAATRAAISTAKSHKICRICIPTSPLIHDTKLTDALIGMVRAASMVPIISLTGAEDILGVHATYAGIAPISDKPEQFAPRGAGIAKATEKCRTAIELKVGPNMLYEALDSIDDGC